MTTVWPSSAEPEPLWTNTLFQNQPNPFNPRTMVRFHLAKETFVVLDVFGVKGDWVCNLIRAKLPPGAYAAEWGARDHAGGHVASGIYLVRLEAGDYSATKKMVLLK